MAQGMLERVVKEANTSAAEPSDFNAKLRAIEKQLYGIETLSLSRLRQARETQDRRIKLKHGQDYRPISLDALRTFRCGHRCGAGLIVNCGPLGYPSWD